MNKAQEVHPYDVAIRALKIGGAVVAAVVLGAVAIYSIAYAAYWTPQNVILKVGSFAFLFGAVGLVMLVRPYVNRWMDRGITENETPPETGSPRSL